MNRVHDNPYDVAIIGYGPVGVTAANLLGSMGLKVLVAEREPSVYGRARAISTDEEVLRIWQQVGLAERLKQDMLSDRPIEFVDGRGCSFLSFAPMPRGNGHPPQLFIYQPALEAVLREGVDRYPDVEVLLEHECVRLWQDGHGVELALLDLAHDQVRRVRAAYVIAADGGSSQTRGQLGIGFAGRTYEDRWVVIDTKVLKEWPQVDRLRFHCNGRRPAVDCPTPLGHHRWEFPVLPGDDKAEMVSEPGVRRLLAGQGIGPENVEILRAVVYSHHVRFAARWRAGRVFLAGDAAHVMPPWIGQGMASGVRDVGNLCWKLAAVTAGELTDSVLDSYETERMPQVRAVTARAVFFGRVITERRRSVIALRDPAFRVAMRLPLVGAYLRSARWLPSPRYADGFFDAPHRRFGAITAPPAVGDKIPQPWVLDSHGERVRFDDLLGQGWRALHLASAQAKVEQWRRVGVGCIEVRPVGAAPAPGAVVDLDGTLLAWMQRRRVGALAVRPDRFVYSAADATGTLSAPTFCGSTRCHGALMPTAQNVHHRLALAGPALVAPREPAP